MGELLTFACCVQADLLGLDYKDITRLAGHDKDVCQEHYLPASLNIVHQMAGFGKEFQTRHFLGRQQQPRDLQAWAELKEHAIPGLDAMRASATGEVAATLREIDILREVFLQDAVLKLQEHGEAYQQHFPQLHGIVQHSCWEAQREHDGGLLQWRQTA